MSTLSVKERADSLGKERALVVQGSLGRRGENGRPTFEIVAGTSIGATNATILASYEAVHKTN